MRSPACSCNGEPPMETTPEVEIDRRPRAPLRSHPSLATTERFFVREELSCVETPAEALGAPPIAPPSPRLMGSPRIGLEVKCRSPYLRPRDSQSILRQAVAHRRSEPATARFQVPMQELVWMAPAARDAGFHSRPPPGTRHRSVYAAPFDWFDQPRSAGQSLVPLSSFPQSIVVMPIRVNQ
jgi:hypothetical protein